MIEMNLICHCDHVPCGAERSVRIRVTVTQYIGTLFENSVAVDVGSLERALESVEWKYERADGERRERVLCPTHSETK